MRENCDTRESKSRKPRKKVTYNYIQARRKVIP